MSMNISVMQFSKSFWNRIAHFHLVENVIHSQQGDRLASLQFFYLAITYKLAGLTIFLNSLFLKMLTLEIVSLKSGLQKPYKLKWTILPSISREGLVVSI